MNPLMSLARALLQAAISQILGQQNLVSEMVRSPMNAFIQQVMGGVWIGKGADAFVQSVQQEAFPVIENFVGSTTTLTTHINNAIDIMEQADREASQVVQTLVGIIEAI